jgi:lipoyl(octanoyl) transferase
VAASVEWRTSEGLTSYAMALGAMEERVEAVRQGASELVWLLEHPPLYTLGTSAKARDLLAPGPIPVFPTNRGGQVTYHGPGQRVIYAVLDLNRRGRDVRCYVNDLESWMIRTLARLGVVGERRAGRVGIWVARPGGGEDKIAAIGVRIRRWIAFHGASLNVRPDLTHYRGIVPCGMGVETGLGVTSLEALGLTPSMERVDQALREEFAAVFGATPPACAVTLSSAP